MTTPSTTPLADPADVADALYRDLADDEYDRVARLIDKASALLRQATLQKVDYRIAVFQQDPTNYEALDPTIVSTVVAAIVKRFVTNVEGAVSTTQTAGPFSESKSFALRGDKDVRGQMVVTAEDLAALAPAVTVRSKVRTLRLGATYTPKRVFTAQDILASEFLDFPAFQQYRQGFQEGLNMAYTPASNNPTTISGAVVQVTAAATLTWGREHEVAGSTAFALAIPTGVTNGSILGVKISESYTGTGITVNTPTGQAFPDSTTSVTMTAGQELKFSYDGSKTLIS